MNRLKQIVIGFLFVIPILLVLSTVFVIDTSLANGVVSGKYFWFCASMGILNLSILILACNRKVSLRFTMQDLLVLLLAGSIYFSSFIINDASQNTTKLILLTLLVILYFTLKTTPKSPKTTPKSPKGDFGAAITSFGLSRSKSPLGDLGVVLGVSGVAFIVITGLVEAIWGLRQLYGFSPSQHSLFKLTGSFFNPGPYAGYLAVVFPLALYYWVHGTRYTVQGARCRVRGARYTVHGKWRRVHGFRIPYTLHRVPCTVHPVLRTMHLIPCTLYRVPQIIACATCIAILLVLPAAMSRASWLAVIAGSLIVLCGHYSGRFSYFKNYYEKHRKKILLTGIAVLISLFAAFSGMYYLKKDSADGRSLMWKIALQTAKKHPFGVGLGNFSGAYGDAQAAYFASGKGTETEEYVAGSPEYGFNEYLQIMVEAGVISLILFIAIVFLSLKSLIINRKWGVAGSMVSLLVFAFFSYPFSILPFLIIFVFLLGNGTDGTQMTQITQIHASKKIRFVLIRVFCVICVPLITAFCLHKAYPVYQAYKKWNTSKIYYNARLYKDIAKDYKELYPLLNDQIQFLFEYAQSLSKSEQYTESNEVLKRAVQISCDPMLYNIMGKNHQALKEYEQAEACLMKASHIIPNRLYPFYLLTKLYHEMGLQDKVNEMADIVQTKEPKVHSRAVEEMREEVRKLRIRN